MRYQNLGVAITTGPLPPPLNNAIHIAAVHNLEPAVAFLVLILR